MSFDYTATRTRANTVLAKFGQTVTLTSRTSGSRNLTTGVSTVSTATQTAYAVLFDYPPGIELRSGGSILSGDKQCYLSGLKTAGTALTRPDVNHTLTDANSVAWNIIAVSELSPAGTPALYELQLRGVN